MDRVVPERIKLLRKEREWSRGKLAELCGVTAQAIEQAEIGKTKNPRWLPVLIDEFETTKEYLTGKSNTRWRVAESLRKAHNKGTNSPQGGEMDAIRGRLLSIIMGMSEEELAALYTTLRHKDKEPISPSLRGATS
jgi:DNA-binding XRE family transcriptional regulator